VPRAAGIEAAITVRADPRLGTVVMVRLDDPASRSAATDALARLPVGIEFE
jgi:hypothetical protein